MIHKDIDQQIGEGLKELRRRIELDPIPPSELDETLNIATWNIREFGKKPREKASIHYIAEILSQFDLITLIEVRDNLTDLYRVMDVLGNNWRVMFSDYNKDSAGNSERLAYLYDTRAVITTGLAAETDPYREKYPKRENEYMPSFTWWRSPYMASFRSGNFDFILLAAHIRWGDNESSRIVELRGLADWVEKRTGEPYNLDKDFIIMGDFNIPELDDDLFKAVTDKGLNIPEKLRGVHGSDLARKKRYDQILFNTKYSNTFTDKGGVLDFYQGDYEPLFPAATYPKMTKTKFTFEISDHLPLWMQINTWVDDEQLDQFLAGQRKTKKTKPR
jgi:endonuclease/exonuclease/phosphatase family metal-dependent hydrolase